jgi:hypothetical protein
VFTSLLYLSKAFDSLDHHVRIVYNVCSPETAVLPIELFSLLAYSHQLMNVR